MSRLEGILNSAPEGDPKNSAVEPAYQSVAEELLAYIGSHKPVLTVAVRTESPDQMSHVTYVSVSSPEFKDFPHRTDGNRMLSNALTLLQMMQPQGEHDDTFADIAVKSRRLASSAAQGLSYSPYHGGADTTFFVPSSEMSDSGILLAVQDRRHMRVDEMSGANALSLGRSLGCETSYSGPPYSQILPRIRGAQLYPLNPGGWFVDFPPTRIR